MKTRDSIATDPGACCSRAVLTVTVSESFCSAQGHVLVVSAAAAVG